ncbi:MAG: glycosyltransferase family 39 protein [Polyangiaceae bacterium]|nr:glycosyltransferase family 39 protein [Polyangiaceae bacterium]
MRLADIARDEDGLPITSVIEERVSLAIAAVATLFFAFVATWEIGAPPLSGHYASSASVGIIAENMWKWGIWGPVWEYTSARPGPEAYYCHHPWGIFWTTALLMKVFGRHDFICRLAPVILSVCTPPLLFGLGRAIYRPAAGAAAALAFVVLPISLSFAAFNALEVPVMAWTLVGLYGYVRFLQTYKRRFGAIGVVGFLFAMNADWPSFVLVASILAFAMVRVLSPGRVFGPVKDRRYAAFWMSLASAAVITFGLYLVLFSRSGKINDLLGAYNMRSAGSQVPLATVLASRRYWIELSFTPIAIFLGKVAAFVALLRVVLTRREEELVPLHYLGMAAVQYVVFKQGADVHVFWPHTFAAYLGLGTAALVATCVPIVERALKSRWARGRWKVHYAAVAALGLFAAPLLFVLRESIPALVYARQTGGRFDERGRLIDSDADAITFLKWLAETPAMSAAVETHEGLRTNWAYVWALGGRVVYTNRPVPKTASNPGDPLYLADSRFMYDDLQSDLVGRFQVTAVGSFWRVDRSKTGLIEAFSIRESEPSWLTWYFVSGTEPVRTIVPDALATWEWRVHFGQPADLVTASPTSLSEKRVLHNMALSTGDTGKAQALFGEIAAEFKRIDERFDDGTQIVGARYVEGVRPTLTLLIQAGGPAPKDAQLTVKSKVVARAPFTLSVPDAQEREVGLPLAIAPERWKKGFLYFDEVPIRKRMGREVFHAMFWARRHGTYPKPISGKKSVEVLALD